MNAGLLRGVVASELRQHLRDPLTLLLMVALPLVVTPLVGLAGQHAVTAASDRASAEQLPVASDGTFALPESVTVVASEQMREAVESGEAEAALRRTRRGGAAVYVDSRRPKSREAAARLETAARDQLRAEAPRRVELVDTTSPEESRLHLLARLLPALLLFTLSSGGLYTALDIITGEKERGTLETLLTTRASRALVATGKFITVFLFAAFSGILTLLAAWGAATFGGGVQLPVGTVALAGLLFLPLCGLATALLSAAAAWSPDFKSGQIIALPALLLPPLLAGAAALPGLELNPLTALIPVVGAALATREVILGSAPLVPTALAFLGSAATAGAALLATARLFGREDVVLGARGGGQRRLRGDYRADAAVLFVVAGAAVWFLGQLAQSASTVLGTAFTQFGLFLPLAFGFVVWVGLPTKPTMSLPAPRSIELLRGFSVGLGLPAVGLSVGWLQAQWLPAPTSMWDGVFPEDTSLAVLLLTFALAPGLCEELLFRGSMMGLYRTSARPWVANLVTAVAFGALHLSIFRFFPTAALGLLLGALAIRSRSVWPGVVAHATNNGLAMVAVHYGIPLEASPGIAALAALSVLLAVVRLPGTETR